MAIFNCYVKLPEGKNPEGKLVRPLFCPEIAQPEVFGRVAAHLVLATLQVAAPRREAMGAAQALLRSWVETRWLICGVEDMGFTNIVI